MYIPSDDTQNYSVDYNLWIKRLDTQLNEQTNQNSTKVHMIVKPTNKKSYFKTLGTSVINSPMSPTFLVKSPYNNTLS